MTLTLSPRILRAAYAYLRECRPFCRWKLPDAFKINFVVIKDQAIYGMYDQVDGEHIICVSSANVGHTMTLIRVMAHEMTHLRQRLQGMDTEHNKTWRRYAKSVCRVHGFDPVEF